MSFQSQDANFHPHDVSRRARGAMVVLVAAFVFLGGAFFRAQVVRHESYTLQSRNNRLREVPLPAPRGFVQTPRFGAAEDVRDDAAAVVELPPSTR